MKTSTHERASSLQARFAQQVKDIREDSHLSPDGRQSRLAQAFLRTRDELRRLQAKERETLAQRRRELERTLFGIGPDRGGTATLSYRDAQERVAALRSIHQALSLLARAERSGDEVLARAVAARAWDRNWTSVLDAYASERAGVLQKFHELDELERLERPHHVASGMAYRLSRPRELGAVSSDKELRRLAAD